MTTPAAPSPFSLGISIVLYHSDTTRLAALLSSLNQSIIHARDAGALAHVELSLVDNSVDQRYHEEVELLLERVGPELQATLITNTDNPGFGTAHNQVLRESSCDLSLILNPDVELSPDALMVGVKALRADDSVLLVSPHVTGPNGNQEFLCKRYPSVRVLLLRAFGTRATKQRFSEELADYECRDLCSGAESAEIQLASGAFMLVRTPALQTVGGFDEAFFLYFEDFDLSLRLSQHGRLLFLPQMRIIHVGGYAASKGMRHIAMFMTGGVRFFNRHGWRWL